MSTRGALGFRLLGKEYIAYNHFDSYPGGLGYDVISFVQRVNAEDGWTNLKSRVSQLLPAAKGQIPRTLEGVALLHSAYDGAISYFPDDADFMKDGLFNEYSYIINLDKMTLECYDACDLKGELSLNNSTKESLKALYKEEE